MKRDSTCSAVIVFAARFQRREFGEGAMIVNCVANCTKELTSVGPDALLLLELNAEHAESA
jgi:hypothetical protein